MAARSSGPAASTVAKSAAAASQNGSQTSGVAQLVGRRRARVPLDDLTECERAVLAVPVVRAQDTSDPRMVVLVSFG